MTSNNTANQTRVIPCASFDDFLTKVRTTKWGFPRIFRGQRDTSWPLSSVWERKLNRLRGVDINIPSKPKSITIAGAHERNIDEIFDKKREGRNLIRDHYLENFRYLIIGLPGVKTESLTNEQDIWALGRHHGLITPLLDWTRSPFVALFFACFDHIDRYNEGFKQGLHPFGVPLKVCPCKPVAVWELAYDNIVQVTDEFEIFSSRVDQAHRQKAQQGLFTFLTHSTALDLESYLKERTLGFRLTRYEIPGAEVGRSLWNLRLMNITYGVLFPDLEGAAIETNIAQTIQTLCFSYDPSK